MIYIIIAKLIFTSRGAAKSFHDRLLLERPNLTTINPGLPQEEASSLELQLSHHDESPTTACEILSSWSNATRPPQPAPAPEPL